MLSRSPLYSSPPDFGRGGAALEPHGFATARRVHSTFALGAPVKDRQLSESSDVELRDLAYLNLDLARHQLDGAAGAANTQLDSTIGAASEQDPEQGSADHVVETDNTVATCGSAKAQENTAVIADEEDAAHSVVITGTGTQVIPAVEDERPDSHTSFHLTKTRISQQLRSMSQLSGPSDESDRLTPEAWTFHQRERSDCITPSAKDRSTRSRHMHQTSESGVSSACVPASWGQVKKDPDASSSIYSRPTSPEMPGPYEIPADLAAVADWPLKPEKGSSKDLSTQNDITEVSAQPNTSDDSHITIVEPNLLVAGAPEPKQKLATPQNSSPSITVSRAPSYKSSSSSTTKHSRFLERFTPPKKLVRKRRSFFKFLRAGSRHQQSRSASTPVLCSPHLRPFVDGPAEDNELLTVQYELAPSDVDRTRSVSLNNLPSTGLNETQGVASSPDLRRKPSLAEYERHLSVVGDNRRNPSAKDLNRLSQIEEDDRHEHIPTKASFSYFSQTQDTNPLMQAALERQMREKALFRSHSKRSIPLSDSSTMSFLATSWVEPSSAQPQSPERDPLDTEGKKPSASHLSPPRTPVDGRSRTSSFSHHKPSNSKKPIILHTPSSVSKDSVRSRIASSLDSWSRYPSHTRGDRCASAGPADQVRTFDFALDIKHGHIRGTDESDPFNPGKRVLTETSSTKASKKHLPKSRSATFGSFVRYYSNLFSSPDFHGKGRRTSIAAGGKLKHPELEILPHILPTTESSQTTLHVHELEPLNPGHPSHIKEQTEDVGYQAKDSSKDNHHHQHKLGQLTATSISFRGNSVFVPHDQQQPTQIEQSTAAAVDDSIQSDDPSEYFSAEHGNSPPPLPAEIAERTPDLDGTIEPTALDTDPVKRPTLSKAETWSESYQDCLIIPPSPADHTTSAAEADAKAMPPPLLKSTKGRRSPTQQQFSLDPSAAIRRFPSVTVVDDRKGHWRSVSFISVKSSKSAASAASFVRESSNDLLKLMEAREREEREKLLRPVV